MRKCKDKGELSHEERVAQEAEEFRKRLAALFEAYTKIDAILTRRPLKSVIGPTEHHDYMEMIRMISMRAWCEIEGIDGSYKHEKQTTLKLVE